jgi:hypothetical protein
MGDDKNAVCTSSGICTGSVCSLGCDEIRKPGSGESPQAHLRARSRAGSDFCFFFWQQLASFIGVEFDGTSDLAATTGLLQQPQVPTLAVSPQQHIDLPATERHLPDPAGNGHPTLPTAKLTSTVNAILCRARRNRRFRKGHLIIPIAYSKKCRKIKEVRFQSHGDPCRLARQVKKIDKLERRQNLSQTPAGSSGR